MQRWFDLILAFASMFLIGNFSSGMTLWAFLSAIATAIIIFAVFLMGNCYICGDSPLFGWMP